MSLRTAPSIAFVTGADAFMFGQIFLLLGSLARHSPGVRLYVCDFGFDAPQRDYLARTGRLLERPAGRPPARHVWDHKAALGAYIARLEADWVVWLDADLVILGDLPTLVGALCAEMEADDQIVAAAGSDAFSLGSLDWLERTPRFKQAMSARHLDCPYLNSGFIVCRSREFLDHWTAQTTALPREFLFEQNAFNLVAYEQPERLRRLDPWVWNLCGTEFRSAQVLTAQRDLALSGPSGRVHILHATSTEKAKDLERCDFHLHFDGALFRPQVRVVGCLQTLKRYQMHLVATCIQAEMPALIASGFGDPARPLLGMS
jgi:hypothetical protein